MTKRIEKPDTETDIALKSRLDSNTSRHFIMVAGAGSGKTTSLVKALAYINQLQGAKLRTNGQKVACITFTEVAVSEINEDVGHDSLYHVSTIHSFLWALIKPFQKDINEWVHNRLKKKIQDNQNSIDNPRTRQRTKDQARAENDRFHRDLSKIKYVKSFHYGTGSDYANGILGHSDIIKIGPEFIKNHALMRKVLSRRYPIIFVDESQDTDPDFVEALRLAGNDNKNDFCIGFFGDPVQKIFMQGAGLIPIELGWEKLEKPENFRCSQSVLRVINKIRAEDDGLQQTRGRHDEINGTSLPFEGSTNVIIMPDDERRQLRTEEAREWLYNQKNDDEWREDNQKSLRMLVLVHRAAADRLGFPNLYSALNDKSSESLKSGVVDGTAWILKPLLTLALPLAIAQKEERAFNVMQLLRKHCPKLRATSSAVQMLSSLKQEVSDLREMLETKTTAKIGDILSFIKEKDLFALDDRFLTLIEEYKTSDLITEPLPENASLRFMQCSAEELWGYREYIDKLSPFATQQGIKGAEFEKVIVVIDDKERQLPGFSYGKYLGFTPLSEKDEENISNGIDSVIDRTRRLFYVCCSRALSDLAIFVFTDDTERMKQAILNKGIFRPETVHILE